MSHQVYSAWWNSEFSQAFGVLEQWSRHMAHGSGFKPQFSGSLLGNFLIYINNHLSQFGEGPWLSSLEKDSRGDHP